MVVTLCVICPMLVGYVWPTSTDTDTVYDLGSGTNITKDLIDPDDQMINIYGNYTDVFQNNINVFSTFGRPYANLPVTISNTTSAAPYMYATVTAQSVETDEDDHYTLDPRTWAPGSSVLVFESTGWGDITIDYHVASKVVYYRSSDQMYVIDAYGRSMYQVPVGNLNFNNSDYDGYGVVTFGHMSSYANYAVLEYGFQVPTTLSNWYNGYDNQAIDILFEPAANSTTTLVVKSTAIGDSGTTISIICSASGDISLKVGNTTRSLGNLSVYPYVLLNIDYLSERISLSGLKGMQSFLSNYEDATRYTVSIPWNARLFSTFSIVSTSAYVSWYVPKTVSAVSQVSGGIIDSYFRFKEYSADYSQIRITGLQVYPVGDSLIGIGINGFYRYGNISMDGTVTFPDFDNATFALNNMNIGLIDNTIYINGKPVYQSNVSITSCNVWFGESWLMNVTFYPIIEKTETSFNWVAGGFGLSANGFCIVGMITSVLSAIAASMYGRRSGIKTGLVILTATLCAAVYLTILMEGMFV